MGYPGVGAGVGVGGAPVYGPRFAFVLFLVLILLFMGDGFFC